MLWRVSSEEAMAPSVVVVHALTAAGCSQSSVCQEEGTQETATSGTVPAGSSPLRLGR